MIIASFIEPEYAKLYLIDQGKILREESKYYDYGTYVLDYDFYLDGAKISQFAPYVTFIEEWTYEDTWINWNPLDPEDINFDNELDWFTQILKEYSK